MTEFKIEKNVKIPERGKDLGPWRELKIGESYFIPCGPEKAGSVAGRVLGFARRSKWEGKLTTSQIHDGVRVWRIK